MTVILLGIVISIFLSLVIVIGKYTKLKSTLLFVSVFCGIFYLFIAFTVFDANRPHVSERMVQMYYAEAQ